MNDAYIDASSVGKKFYFLFSLMEYEDIPIVFVVKDDEDEIYLCDCTEFRDSQKWIIAKTDCSVLYSVTNQKLSVYDALKKYEEQKILVTYNYELDQYETDMQSFDSLSDEDLPKKGAMVRYLAENAAENLRMLAGCKFNKQTDSPILHVSSSNQSLKNYCEKLSFYHEANSGKTDSLQLSAEMTSKVGIVLYNSKHTFSYLNQVETSAAYF